ncbi:MAG: hypothetical protein KAR20_01445, partial [Candidatus Heimdallarchaeota archaeon]|nr:hypothetical protein [Candidatus Heimdallarchaeota archaeon]
MKRFFQNTKCQKLTSFLVLIPFMFYVAALSLQVALISPSTSDVAYASDESMISRQSAKQLLGYLKELDTNTGRADFQLYIDDLQLQKDRLIRVRNNLVYQFVKAYQFQSQASS